MPSAGASKDPGLAAGAMQRRIPAAGNLINGLKVLGLGFRDLGILEV